MAKQQGTISHRDRKNPNSRQEYRELKHKLNAERGKQTYNFETKEWTR
jgi:hypothetical protein